VTVLVAGATSALGRALLPQLIADRHSVRAVARGASTADLPAGAESIDADLLQDDLFELVRECDAVVDLTGHRRAASTRRLLDAALAARVPRYVQQSIVMAYRGGGDAWLDEEAPLDDSPERAAICGPVIEMEAMVRTVPPQTLGWTILRGGSFVGALGAWESMLIEALRAGTVVVAGSGSNYLSPVNVTDMASAIVLALELAPAGSTFNIVDEPLRYGDYVDGLADLIGVARPRRAAALPLPPSWRCTNNAAQAALGWMPRDHVWPYGRFGL
jgi:nucleoside-diphosphate-sugar epimerase